MSDLEVQPGVIVPEDAIALSAVRSSGPGGQNVNKVASKVVLRVEVDRIRGLSPEARQRLCLLAGSRWVEGDCLVITASETRNQPDNRKRAEERLVALIRQALVEPKTRRRTRPTKGSRERRLAAKQARGALKQERNRPPEGQD
jgi:ribosome-associated protein